MAKDYLVFDMDGVLVDVTESYRETIARTVEHFSGKPMSHTEIQDYKNRGGFNDDWKLSHTAIQERGGNPDFQSVVDYFQAIFHGRNGEDGLMLRERWIASEGLFQRLSQRYRLGVFTGRFRWEAELTLNRFGNSGLFSPIVGTDDVANSKPAPDGLLQIIELACDCKTWYIGDTVDDARCAEAARVPFIGIAAKGNPRYDELLTLFRRYGAVAVLDDINGIEGVVGT